MGASQSTPTTTPSPLQTCLDAVCAGRADCVAYAPASVLGQAAYQLDWVRPYNLAIDVTPAAVVRPPDAAAVAAAVQCAAASGLAVQARSGGHSYANFGLGGSAAAATVSLDLAALDGFRMDNATWHATIGPAATLGAVTQQLVAHGNRALAHGVCPGVALGGHATVGGLGPMSRMWGTCLDHVVAADVVTANGSLVRASADQNPDLFFALRGAGASFGIVTSFTLRTHSAPGHVVQSTFDIALSNDPAALATVFAAWQALIADPALDRRFGSEFVLHPLGAIITATFYGTAAEWHASGIPARLPANGTLVVRDWLGALAQDAENELLYLSNTQTSFYSKSLAVTRANLLSDSAILALFQGVYGADGSPLASVSSAGTPLWFIIFDASGGAVADVPQNATAYAHRDALYFYQSYAIDLLASDVSAATRSFLDRFHSDLLQHLPDNSTAALGTYPGYVDPAIAAPQQEYYASNLPVLEKLKAVWDPNNVFRNPQSVKPAAS